MANHIVENTGVHLHSLIERTECKTHNASKGVPCYHLPNNMQPEAYYVGACGKRVREAGFNGKISPMSMRTHAPRKTDNPAGKKPWAKKPNTMTANRPVSRSYAK